MANALEGYLAYLGRRPITRLVTVQLGVWEVIYKEEYKPLLPGIPSKDDIKNAIGLLPSVCRFLREIYSFAPRQTIIYIIDIGLESLKSGVTLYLQGSLLDAVCSLKIHWYFDAEYFDVVIQWYEQIISRMQGSKLAATVIYRAIIQQLVLSVASVVVHRLM